MPRQSIPLPDPAYLHQILRLDPWKGELYWRERPREHFEKEWVWRGWNTRYAGKRAGDKGYGRYHRVNINGVLYRAHRVVWAMDHWDRDPSSLDHRNGNTFDNRPSNLRAATHAENMRHRTRVAFTSRSGVRGVTRYNSTNRWLAQLTKDGKRYRLGVFDTVEEAAMVVAEARLRLFGEFAGLV